MIVLRLGHGSAPDVVPAEHAEMAAGNGRLRMLHRAFNAIPADRKLVRRGTITRSGKLQLTVAGLPAYTYHGDTAGIVTCDNVDGWHAVRAH